jgi:FkbM family methyltransferase
MNPLKRLIREYAGLARILRISDLVSLAGATVRTAPSILRTGKLTDLDIAMSRNLTVQYRGKSIVVPVADIDRYLASHGGDNPTFGNVREMYALDCYLNRISLPPPLETVLDLGANRGMFSLLALRAFDAKLVIGVEPNPTYNSVLQTLLNANQLNGDRAIRYDRYVTSPSAEKRDPASNISIETICEEHNIERITFAKIDIEGYERDLFSEPQWLARVDTLAMEVHPGLVGDLSIIPQALSHYAFDHISVSQFGEPRDVNEATFLYASRTGALIESRLR